MSIYQGIGVNPGKVIGPVKHMPPALAEPKAGLSIPEESSAEAEAARLKGAASAVAESLKARARLASEDAKAVLEATALMAKDPMLLKASIKKIDTGLAAERAVWEAAEGVASMLLQLGGYMAERSRDVYDVRARIVAQLRGVTPPGIPESTTPFILLAEDLAPADTATLDPAKVLALVTSGGGPQSHTAIIARALGLPAVVASAEVLELAEDDEVFVDGGAGLTSNQVSDQERSAVAAWAVQSAKLSEFDGVGQLADGAPVPLLANVGNTADAQAAAEAGAEGIGLFRTEFLFLERDTEPSLEEQVAAYQGVFEAFPSRKVVVRTLDAGADKPLPFLSNSEEPNPALGVRGYRTELCTPGVLGRQLQAIAQAAKKTQAASETQAEVWVMAPMISTPGEAAEFAAACTAAGLKTAGVMIEVPSAAVSARTITRHVDFVSLGTNDLTQYTMAADRQLAPLAALNDPWQPAVLSLISVTCNAADQTAAQLGTPKPVGVCGEAAADPALAVVLVGLGVNTLSMTARALPAVAAVLKSVTTEQAQQIAADAMQAESAAKAREIARKQLPILEELGI